MSRIRSSRNVTTELELLSLLRAARLRGWRRNFPLTGKPDFVFPGQKLVVFVDGCFWHGHVCGRNLTPKRNAHYWREKVLRNRRRDRKVERVLRRKGWKVVRIWECALARRPADCIKKVVRYVACGVKSDQLTENSIALRTNLPQ